MHFLSVPVDAFPSPLNLISAGLVKEKRSLDDTPQWFSEQSGKKEGGKFHSRILDGQINVHCWSNFLRGHMMQAWRTLSTIAEMCFQYCVYFTLRTAFSKWRSTLLLHHKNPLGTTRFL